MRLLIVASLVSLGACAFEPSGPGEPGPGPDPDPPLPADVDAGITPEPPLPAPIPCRVDGANLGVVGLGVEVPGKGIYRFDAWQYDDEDLVGFTLSGPPEPRYEVRADRDHFWGTEMYWVHPYLSADRDLDAITRVDFCADPPGPGGPGPGPGV